jgi:hypothetical protein
MVGFSRLSLYHSNGNFCFFLIVVYCFARKEVDYEALVSLYL